MADVAHAAAIPVHREVLEEGEMEAEGEMDAARALLRGFGGLQTVARFLPPQDCAHHIHIAAKAALVTSALTTYPMTTHPWPLAAIIRRCGIDDG